MKDGDGDAILFVSTLVGIGMGLVSSVLVPWYAAVGVGVLVTVGCVFVFATILLTE